jgi:uncharacterized protein YqeY
LRILERLRADLATALRSRNTVEVSMVRTLIGVVENAGAVEAESTNEVKKGLGHDVPRRELTDEDVHDLLENEHSEVAEALAHYRDLGLDDQIAEMETRLSIVERYL